MKPLKIMVQELVEPKALNGTPYMKSILEQVYSIFMG